MNDYELIQNSLEKISEKTENIAPLVYEKFFIAYPETLDMFGIDPYGHVKSTMILNLLLELSELAKEKSPIYNIERWVNEHIGYGVKLPMYAFMLDCLHQSITEVLSDTWNNETQLAWQNQYQKLNSAVENIYTSNP